jgi:hypothetical protein
MRSRWTLRRHVSGALTSAALAILAGVIIVILAEPYEDRRELLPMPGEVG